jgi:cardiolipin synthase
MNLHRSSNQPDWDIITESDRTSIQRLAKATNGLVTPPNIITVLGLGIVVVGLLFIVNQDYWTGLVLVAIGRLLDIVDGIVADKTGTKSSVGEIFDSAADKTGTIFTVIAIIIAGITEWWIIAALLIPQIIIPLVSYYKKKTGNGVHPTRTGKISMALAWVGIVGLLLVTAIGSTPSSLAVVNVCIVISFVLGMIALWQYVTGRD